MTMKPTMPSPKTKFIEAGLKLFAARGYYGVSLADVANELGLTKQAVLYHFKTKEALYATILSAMADRYTALVADAKSAQGTAEERFAGFIRSMFKDAEDLPEGVRLITRELLDNPERASNSQTWFMRDFLNGATELLGAMPGWEHRDIAEQRAALYQIIGSMNYLAISEATLRGIWGETSVEEMQRHYVETLLEQRS